MTTSSFKTVQMKKTYVKNMKVRNREMVTWMQSFLHKHLDPQHPSKN